VPLQLLVDKFTHLRFEPSGFTKNSEIPMAKSIMDYIFKWLAIKFLSRDSQEHAGVILREEPPPARTSNITNPTASDLSFLEKVTTATATPAPVPVDSPSKVVGFVMPPRNADGANTAKTGTFLYQQDAPSCSDCGEIMVRNGACYKCLNCGSTSGCS
jgi:ribonucleoside-diphosphate reductase alpha chain